MEEKTREELIAEFAKKIFDEAYFSTFSDEGPFREVAKGLEEHGISLEELDAAIKDYRSQFSSRPGSKDNLFDIIEDEFSRNSVKKIRDLFSFNTEEEFKKRAEKRAAEKKAEEQAEALEVAEQAEAPEVAEQEQPVAAEAKQQAPAAKPVQNVFNMGDPQTAAINQQLAAAKSNPFLAGTDAERAQIANLLDIGNGKVAMPNRSDRRSMAQFNNDVKSKEFVLNAAKRKARDLQSLDESRRAMIEGSEDIMAKWIEANPSHAMSKKGLDNWTDKDKVNFYRNYKLGNLSLDKPLPPQDPFTEETKTNAMLTQPTGPESFDLFFAEGPKSESGNATDKFGPRREYIFTDPTRPEKPRDPESFELFMPQNEDGYASADSKPFSVDTGAASTDKFGPRREYIFRDPTRPEKPIEPESFELFMPQNEDGNASADKFGPRREFIFRDPTRPEKPIEPESFELFMPQNESGFASADSKPFSVDTTSAATDKFGPRREYMFRDPTRPEKTIEPESFELFMPQNESGYASVDPKPTSDNKFGPRRDLMTRPFPQPKSEPLNLFNITDEDVAKAEKAKETQQNAFTDLEEAGRIESLRNELADVNRQREIALKNASIVQENVARQAAQKAQLAAIKEGQRLATERNLTDTKNYYNQAVPTYGKRNDGTYGVMYDPRSSQTMKDRAGVMKSINNSKSGNPFQDFMDETLEERERKKKQQAFVSQSKASPFYKNIFG